MGDLRAYSSFAIVVDPDAPSIMKEDRRRIQAELHEETTRLAQQYGVPATSAVVEARSAGNSPFSKKRKCGFACYPVSPTRFILIPPLRFSV